MAYPAYTPVIPMMAYPFLESWTTVKESGRAFPTAKIVRPK